MGDLRCPSRLHGEVDDDTIEVKCRSKTCGAGNGVVVLHKFRISTGELLVTKKFRNPPPAAGQP